ncbi:MAG: hypothetical protein WC856_27010 [Methylococcaceae bacterium]
MNVKARQRSNQVVQVLPVAYRVALVKRHCMAVLGVQLVGLQLELLPVMLVKVRQ